MLAEELARDRPTALLRTGQQVPFYIFTTYIITYGRSSSASAAAMILNFVMIQSCISMITIPLMGHLSDIYGRRTIIAIGCVVMMVFPFIYFGLLDTRSMLLVFLAIALGAAAARPAVRAAGGVHRRERSRVAALQRVVARLPARVDHRRRPGADHRRAAVPRVRRLDRDRGVHVDLRADQPGVRLRAARAPRRARSPLASHFKRVDGHPDSCE